ncbi:hypothetical protein B9Z19DRAFT_1133506 [Tuber borchii]|uniref:Uncharacterized protein n=1 Tax=Tuber borchii TaxID=42251 RepID=A0A2T6ZFR9_TUBBO|nr:hypothetical protein B9Z19DRAFT_1133506 [Tuber borchii]
MKLPTEMVLDSPGGEVKDAAQVEDFETLKRPIEASMGQTSLVMPHASANVPTFVQPDRTMKGIVSATATVQAALPPLDVSFDRYYVLHDGKVHHPLGAGSYIYKKEYISSHIRYLGLPLPTTGVDKIPHRFLPPSTLVIHIGAQPNNSPHIGTIVVFTLAFLIARDMKKYYADLHQKADLSTELTAWIDNFKVLVQLDLVDTAPHNEEGCVRDGINYQRSQRFTKAYHRLLPDYEEIMKSAAAFVGGGIPYKLTNQEAVASIPSVPRIIEAIVRDRERLGPELAPETGALAMRSACPHKGCGLAEKHGRKNKYSISSSGSAIIEFYCPNHGYHSVDSSNPKQVAKLEFNTPLRNLVRAFAYGIQTAESREAARNAVAHGGTPTRELIHMRVTGSDYTGLYSEQLLWRQLILLKPETSSLAIQPPVIAYAPLIQDWAGSKLSKSLYVDKGAYEYLRAAGMGYMLSFDEMKRQGKDHTILFREVERWLDDPRKLFRPYSIDYLHRIFEQESAKEEVINKMREKKEVV